MFGISFGEALLLGLVAVIVIGPRNLPSMMRSLGRFIGKMRRLTLDIREQSGIDDILRAEGIEREVAELRKLAQGRILDINLDDSVEHLSDPKPNVLPPPVHREFPVGGVDTYGAPPEDADPYIPRAPAEGGPIPRGALLDDDEPAHAAPAAPALPEPPPPQIPSPDALAAKPAPQPSAAS